MEEACRNMEETFRSQDMAFGPSVSYGIAQFDLLGAGSVSGLLELADRRMYGMKRKRHKMKAVKGSPFTALFDTMGRWCGLWAIAV